jgi:hypothetical protein
MIHIEMPATASATTNGEQVLVIEYAHDLVSTERLMSEMEFDAFKRNRPTGYPEIKPVLYAHGAALTKRNFLEIALGSRGAEKQYGSAPDPVERGDPLRPKNKPWYQGPKQRRF